MCLLESAQVHAPEHGGNFQTGTTFNVHRKNARLAQMDGRGVTWGVTPVKENESFQVRSSPLAGIRKTVDFTMGKAKKSAQVRESPFKS